MDKINDCTCGGIAKKQYFLHENSYYIVYYECPRNIWGNPDEPIESVIRKWNKFNPETMKEGV